MIQPSEVASVIRPYNAEAADSIDGLVVELAATKQRAQELEDAARSSSDALSQADSRATAAEQNAANWQAKAEQLEASILAATQGNGVGEN